MLDGLPTYLPDPILGLMDIYASDPRPQKVDLGVGVYKNQAGVTPILDCVKSAEQIVTRMQASKTYLGSSGNREYSELVKKAILGPDLWEQVGARTVAFQTVGGTGALRLAADLLVNAAPQAKIWIGTPTWPNHFAVFQGAGAVVEKYVYCKPMAQEIAFSEVLDAANRAAPGDSFLIHACCHNPTGIDLSSEQSKSLLAVLREREVLPVVDCAYAGFAKGFEEDLSIARAALAEFEEAIVCFSCSKNFGLYRDRIGLILVKTKSPDRVKNVMLALSGIARADYSQPPDHGASVIAEILKSTELKAQWLVELEQMRSDMVRKRNRLSAYRMNTPVLKDLASQYGMFSLLPIESEVCSTLRSEFGIYMTTDARINVLGVGDDQEGYLVESLSRVLGRSPLG